ncbi:MAG: cobalamin biosynthesis protein CbiD [Oscillospiraceae bacterium]|nr:cobalamin biosynthesis protein CbiD [Oscillospiraceae bacterium]
MEEYIEKNGKKLRLGYTTGSCAAAAAKAAAWMLLTGLRREEISLLTPKGIELKLGVRDISMSPEAVSCAIEKDSGDDPDVTKGTLIYASVSYSDTPGISIDGGRGVGRVTRPGLDQPVGAAAINSVPRQMILENVEEVRRLADCTRGISVIISAPEGESLAKRTFNPRLGIVGGISILGTTGIVEPMSDQALIDTIHTELRQRRAEGQDYVLLAPGNYGAEYIRASLGLDPEKAVLTSNFIGDALEFCRALGFKGVLLIGHIGKLVKLAGGMYNTHSKYGDCRMEIMAAHAGACGLVPEAADQLLNCVTTDDAVNLLDRFCLREATLDRLVRRIDFMMSEKTGPETETGAILFSKVYGHLCETEKADRLLQIIRRQQGELK